MQSLGEILGISSPLVIDGREVQMKVLTIADIAVVEQAILDGRKKSPLQAAGEMLAVLPNDAPERKDITERAFEMQKEWEQVTLEDLTDFLSTFKGRSLATFLSLRQDNPDITREESDIVFQKMYKELLNNKITEITDRFPDISREDAEEALLGKDAATLLRHMAAEIDGFPEPDPTKPPKEAGVETEMETGNVEA